MNELELLSQMYEEPPAPADAVTAAARRRMNGRRPARRILPPRWRSWMALPAGVLAAGTAAAVAVTVLGDAPRAPGTPDAPPATLSARAVLLAAAAKTEREPLGRYWYAYRTSGRGHVIPARSGPFTVVGDRFEMLDWFGVEQSDGAGFYDRDLPAKVLDKEAWRKAGSPTSFETSPNSHEWFYTDKTGKWSSGPMEVHGDWPPAGKPVQDLPADPARLAKIFFSKGPRGGPATKDPLGRLYIVADALESMPLTPKVRAALLRAAADQPGISAIGPRTDPLGRRGIALASRAYAPHIGRGSARESYTFREELVFDQATGRLLARQTTLVKPGGRYGTVRPGFLVAYSANIAYGFTDTKPKRPAGIR